MGYLVRSYFWYVLLSPQYLWANISLEWTFVADFLYKSVLCIIGNSNNMIAFVGHLGFFTFVVWSLNIVLPLKNIINTSALRCSILHLSLITDCLTILLSLTGTWQAVATWSSWETRRLSTTPISTSISPPSWAIPITPPRSPPRPP